MFRNYLGFVFFIVTSSLSLSATAQDLATTTVEAEPFKQMVYLDGIVEAVQQATLFAQTSGRVIKLGYDVDDFVKKGSVIARLRNTEQKARFNQAKAGRDAAKAEAQKARLEYKRVSGLFAKKLVSASLKDKAEAALKSAEAALNGANARFDEAQEQLDHTVIRAPFSGTLTKRHIELGETLQMGQPVVSGVSEQNALRFNVQIPQRLIETARKLASVDVILHDGRHITADQITVFPTADSKTHSFQLRAQVFSDQYRLYPGMFVKIGLETGLKSQLSVPASSVIHRSELNAVYVLDNGRVLLRQVRLGPALNGRQVILSGLQVGEKIVTLPNQAAIAIKAQLQGE
ncbi:MAG: efflux RND transporter periplasmic adaptor subunit [Gammaproteobacteria bacterium]|nr:efflux RND transporter periplasmic adaptor subunit [Gammaproteobacteria bacterium]